MAILQIVFESGQPCKVDMRYNGVVRMDINDTMMKRHVIDEL
jgi:hypothetical protein